MMTSLIELSRKCLGFRVHQLSLLRERTMVYQFRGLSTKDTSVDEMISSSKSQHEQKLMKIKLKMDSAREMWEASLPIQGTLAETYLHQYRGISLQTTNRLEFRYLPDLEQFRVYIKKDLAPFGSLVVKAQSPEGIVTGIQRVFLDSDGQKVKDLWYAKKVIGVVKGSIGIVQVGTPPQNGTVFLAEGPETGAAIAQVAGPEVTVLASLSSSLFQSSIPNLIAYSPKEVILAIDNDSSPMAQKVSMEAARFLKSFLGRSNINFREVAPYLLSTEEDLKKDKEEEESIENILVNNLGSIVDFLPAKKEGNFDFNDILLMYGEDELKKQLELL